MDSLNNQLAKYTLSENQARSPAFQHLDNVLETMHGTSIYSTLSNHLQVDFQLVIYHEHPLEASPLVLAVQIPPEKFSAAAKVLTAIQKSFRSHLYRFIQYEIYDAPFYVFCHEEAEIYEAVVAKHSTKLVGQWFERSVRFGQAKFFKKLPGSMRT